MSEPLPPLGERFEIREEVRFCVYRVGGTEPIGVSKTVEDAKVCREMCERNEWPWYDKLQVKSATTPPSRTIEDI